MDATESYPPESFQPGLFKLNVMSTAGLLLQLKTPPRSISSVDTIWEGPIPPHSPSASIPMYVHLFSGVLSDRRLTVTVRKLRYSESYGTFCPTSDLKPRRQP
jgi:hypothetical protein